MIVLCILKQVQIITAKNLVKLHSDTIDFQLGVVYKRDALEFNCYQVITHGVLDVTYQRMINILFHHSSTDWTFVSFCLTIENYGNKVICDEIESALADIFFPTNTRTKSVY